LGIGSKMDVVQGKSLDSLRKGRVKKKKKGVTGAGQSSDPTKAGCVSGFFIGSKKKPK